MPEPPLDPIAPKPEEEPAPATEVAEADAAVEAAVSPALPLVSGLEPVGEVAVTEDEPEPPPAATLQLDRKHPLAIRWMHWINFPVLFTMIWSGILIYWNDSDNRYQHPHAVYRVGIGSFTLFRFFPPWFYHAIDAQYQVTRALGYHFFFMWIFALNGIFYVAYLLGSREWKFVVPDGKSIREAIQVTLVDLHIRKGMPPQTKYNGAQKIAYTSVIVMGLGSLVTGLAIYKPTQAHWFTTLLGGYEMARWLHFMLTMGFCAFFLVHVGQVVLAGWNNFRSMISGYEIKSAEEPSLEAGEEQILSDLNALDQEVRQGSGRRTRRSFVVAAAAAAAGYGFYNWIDKSKAEDDLRIPLRTALEFNEKVGRTVFDERGLAPTYAKSKSVDLRVNGNYGLKQELLLDSYRLQMVGVANASAHPRYVSDVTAWDYKYADADVEGGHSTKEAPKVQMPPEFEKAFAEMRAANGNKPIRGNEEAGKSDSTLDPGTPGLLLTLDDVTSLPRHEMVTEFKCIEGWSEIVYWGGVRLADLLKAYPAAPKPDGSLPRYIYMETPNGDYYTGYERMECMHPQSLLVTEMAGRPLTQPHGAPLRLHMPIKYGYKQIKRIGLIAYTDMKPDDYWTKLGYDWYAGL